jgi:sugar lactone lactonase YvrE
MDAVRGRSRRLNAIEAVTGALNLKALFVRSTAFVLAALAAASFVGRADAFVYWTESSRNTIGRANHLDGSAVNVSFISSLNRPQAMAIDGTYLYFVTGLGAIGRVSVDGTGAVDQSFILGVFPDALAVDGAYIYWTTSGPNGNRIGRANLNGSGVNPMFITTTVAAAGVAVDSNFIYWANSGLNSIGRANIADGSGVNQLWIKGAANPQGVAVDGTFIYWVNAGSGRIGRANLNGTGANQFFITAGEPEWIAVDSANIWWTNDSPLYAIGRANLDGTGVSQTFIDTLSAPSGLAINGRVSPGPGGPPPPTITTLASDVQGFGLHHGTERSLLAKLNAAQGNVDAGQLQAACDSLGAFINEVDAQAGKKIDDDQADELVTTATVIRQLLDCGAN